MDGKITYLNTDLDLVSERDLTALAVAFTVAEVRACRTTFCDDGLWRAMFETDEQYDAPEASIAATLNVIESLAAPLRLTWDICRLREFNLGVRSRR